MRGLCVCMRSASWFCFFFSWCRRHIVISKLQFRRTAFRSPFSLSPRTSNIRPKSLAKPHQHSKKIFLSYVLCVSSPRKKKCTRTLRFLYIHIYIPKSIRKQRTGIFLGIKLCWLCISYRAWLKIFILPDNALALV